MIEAASDSGAAQVVVLDDGSVINALRRGDEGAFREILSLEARVTDAVRNLPSVVLYAYDVRGLGADRSCSVASNATRSRSVALRFDKTSITSPPTRFSRGWPRTRSLRLATGLSRFASP